MQKLKLIFDFLVSVLVTFFFASVFHTQSVLAGLSELEVDIPFSARLNMTLQDLIGLSTSYCIILSIGLLLAFLTTRFVIKFVNVDARFIYAIAGALCVLIILVAMQPILNITLLAGARTGLGVGLQMFAGSIGGYTYASLRFRSRNSNNKLIQQG